MNVAKLTPAYATYKRNKNVHYKTKVFLMFHINLSRIVSEAIILHLVRYWGKQKSRDVNYKNENEN